jgi:hypothetical protein
LGRLEGELAGTLKSRSRRRKRRPTSSTLLVPQPATAAGGERGRSRMGRRWGAGEGRRSPPRRKSPRKRSPGRRSLGRERALGKEGEEEDD